VDKSYKLAGMGWQLQASDKNLPYFSFGNRANLVSALALRPSDKKNNDMYHVTVLPFLCLAALSEM